MEKEDLGGLALKTKKKKIRFIINPISGSDKKKNLQDFINRSLEKKRCDFEICITKLPSHATFLAKEAVKLKYDIVVAVGGDGTINEVGKSLVGSDTILGIIPTGSGNGLARHLKLPKDISQSLNVISDYKCISIDTFKINDKISLGMAGIGFDAHVAWKFSGSKTRGLWSYVALIIKDYPNYKPKTFELIIDGNKIVKEAFLLSFANSSQYGNNIKIAAQAQLDDGYIHLAILKNLPFYAVPFVFLMLKNGNIDKSKYYEAFRCKQIEVKGKDIMAHIDGEPILFSKGMRVKVWPKSLKVLIPYF